MIIIFSRFHYLHMKKQMLHVKEIMCHDTQLLLARSIISTNILASDHRHLLLLLLLMENATMMMLLLWCDMDRIGGRWQIIYIVIHRRNGQQMWPYLLWIYGLWMEDGGKSKIQVRITEYRSIWRAASSHHHHMVFSVWPSVTSVRRGGFCPLVWPTHDFLVNNFEF